MTTRRQFVVHAPLGLAGALVACGGRAPDSANKTAAPGGPSISQAGSPVTPLAERIPADAPVLNWIPRHEDLVYTFGGVPVKQRIKSGTRIVSWTEDAFDGAVKTAADLPSRATPPGHDNPQTGPFQIEGAEPGDTVAVHIVWRQTVAGVTFVVRTDEYLWRRGRTWMDVGFTGTNVRPSRSLERRAMARMPDGSAFRRALYHQLSGAQDRKILKGTRWLLLKNPENLDPARHEAERLQEALRLNAPPD